MMGNNFGENAAVSDAELANIDLHNIQETDSTISSDPFDTPDVTDEELQNIQYDIIEK